MSRKYYHQKHNQWIIYVGIALAAGILTWNFWPTGPKTPEDDQSGHIAVTEDITTTNPSANNVTEVVKTREVGAPTTHPGDESTPAALAKYNAGNIAFGKQEHLKARGLLSEALFMGGLTEKLAQDARSKLTYVADMTLFARSIDSNDPYTMRYRFKQGDLPALVERQQRLHVPDQLIVQINGMVDGKSFQAGAHYKLIKGPFHAIVYKDIYKMDLILHRRSENLPPVFIKRYDVGLGQNNSTPPGMWRLGCGSFIDKRTGKRERGKLLRAPWNPPPNAVQRRRIEYNMPGYPFGTKGMWISLVGTDEKTKDMIDYGIHSTDDQNSIGKQASMGCVRMRDDDIQEVYDRLYEYHSTVRIVP